MTEVIVVEDDAPFVSRNGNRLEPLTSDRISSISGIVHGITHRLPGLGRADGNVGFGAPRDAADAFEMRRHWALAVGFEPGSIAGLRQVHGSDVCVVTAAAAGNGATPGSSPAGSADALITNEPGVTLMTLHADCLPILIVDPDVPAVAAVHAGWRGTAENVAGATVDALQSTFGTTPSRLLAFFGPSIGPCCYDVGQEVADAWMKRNEGIESNALRRREGSWLLDLTTANAELLIQAGFDERNIELSKICTKCDGERWFSHRGQGPDTGRFAAFIGIRRERA